jgi:nitroreductase
MDIYEALYTTRSMRRLKTDPIPYDAQARILDAAIRAPHIGEGWRFILVDDPQIKSQLAPLYRQGMERMVGAPLETFIDTMKDDPAMARTLRSGVHLVEHFAEVPLLLIGFCRSILGSGVYPALQNSMLAARA